MDGNARQLAELIVDGAARMFALIDDLLSFAGTGRHEPARCVDLQRTLAVAVENLAQVIQANDAVVTVDRLPVVRGRETHLVRLFQNLLSNALKYRSERPVEIHVTAEGCGPDRVISVKDNGVGIAAENHSLIFTPLARLSNRDIPGSGLGLAVCQRIVEELGGVIWVESKIGAGSTFFFTIATAEERVLAPMTSRGAAV